MEPEPILGSFSLPLSDPRFVFANAAALANFLNGRERDNFEIVRAIGYYDDQGTQVHAGNFYEYEPVEIGEIGPAQPLSVLEVNLPWDKFVDQQVFANCAAQFCPYRQGLILVLLEWSTAKMGSIPILLSI